MGAFGSLIVGLFSLCFRKLKKKSETITRIIILIVVAVILAIIVLAVGEEVGWTIYGIFALLFGWRLIADIVRCFMNKFEPEDEDEEEDYEEEDEFEPTDDDEENEP